MAETRETSALWPPRCRRSGAAPTAMEYLQNHRIEGVLETIVNDVLADQPQNPFQVMAERLAAAAGGSKGGTAAPKELAKQARKAAHAQGSATREKPAMASSLLFDVVRALHGSWRMLLTMMTNHD